MSRPPRRLAALLAAAVALAGTGVGEEPHFAPAVARLAGYLRVDTSNPPGNERAGALYLAAILRKAGIASELHEAAPGRTNLYARLAGTTRESGLLLHHHIDVVPAPSDGWLLPPFAGRVSKNLLYGRGAIDDKGRGIVALEAFLALAASGRPRRDVVFLATADEERGGALGVAAIRRDRPAWLAGIGEAIGEGGDVETVTGTARYFGIEVQQKGALWLRLTARGTGGHAASAEAASPAARIARAVAALDAHRPPLRVEPVLERQLAALARVRPEVQRPLLRGIAALAARDPERVRREASPWQLLLLSDSLAVTRLGTDSEAVNARPRTAWAEVDVRILPSTDPRAAVDEIIARIADPKVTVDVLLESGGDAASPETGVFETVRQVLSRRFPGVVVGPVLGPALSENRVLRAMGIRTYGLTPFRLAYYDAAGIHGVNERVRTDWLAEGVEVMSEVVRTAAGPR